MTLALAFSTREARAEWWCVDSLLKAVSVFVPGERSVPAGLIPLPIVNQLNGYECGVASLISIGRHLNGFKGDRARMRKIMKVDPNIGVTHASIAAGAEHMGLKADTRYGMTEADLEQAHQDRTPVIIEVQMKRKDPSKPWDEEWDWGHYVAFMGMDEQNVYFMDPAMIGRYGYFPRSELASRWHAFTDAGEKTQRTGIIVTSKIAATPAGSATLFSGKASPMGK
jgi:predicted double-glycine peptidase